MAYEEVHSETLPDGSVATVEKDLADPHARNTSLISRYEGDVLVWGQAFARNEDHAGQVEAVLVSMRERPSDFYRWALVRPAPVEGDAEEGQR